MNNAALTRASTGRATRVEGNETELQQVIDALTRYLNDRSSVVKTFAMQACRPRPAAPGATTCGHGSSSGVDGHWIPAMKARRRKLLAGLGGPTRVLWPALPGGSRRQQQVHPRVGRNVHGFGWSGERLARFRRPSRLSDRQYLASQHCKRLDLIRNKRTWVNFQFLLVPIALFFSNLIDRFR